ncbi:MAG: small conductance mechanosensitive channel [Phenylobacterium sp.]|jgi:small conductance mechanosensitive channel
MFEIEQITKLIDTYAIPWGINILLAGLIFFVGRLVAKLVIKLLGKIMIRAKMDPMLTHFLEAIASALLTLFIVLAALNQLGVDTSSLVAMMAAAGLAIGLSLQSSLQNFAAGIMLLVFKPFKVDDMIEAAGVKGIVESIHIFTCTLRTLDNKEMIVPNGSIYGGNIINHSNRELRRVDMVFSIGYDDDLKQAKEILNDIITNHPLVLEDPAPFVFILALGESSIDFKMIPWAKTVHWAIVKGDVTEAVKLRFDAAGISIPYPQMDVHVHRADDNHMVAGIDIDAMEEAAVKKVAEKTAA